MTPDSLAVGFLIGLVATLVVGFLLNLIVGWLHQSSEPNQRQPIVHVTEETPNQVMRRARLANWALFSFISFLGLLGWTWFASRYVEAAATVRQIVQQLVVWGLDVVIQLLQLLRAVIAG